jgi:phospholipid/cholesterol/gamma-HCH transport system substrate-binding protein
METRAGYIVVGSFVIGLIVAGFAFVGWMAKVEFESAPVNYAIHFTGSVTGLQIGSGVRYRGVPVGSVTDIRIDPANIERIVVVIEVEDGTPIKRDTVATLGLQGITGLAYIQLSGGTQASAKLAPRDGERMAEIPSEPSGLEQVLERAPELLEKIVVLADRVSTIVDEKNVQALTDTLANVRDITQSVASQTDRLEGLLASATSASASLGDAAKSFDALSQDLRQSTKPITEEATGVMTDLRKTMTTLQASLNDFSSAARKLEAIADENRLPLRDFSADGLYELSQFIRESRVLVANLTRLAAQIERDPARFFFGDTQRGFQAQ